MYKIYNILYCFLYFISLVDHFLKIVYNHGYIYIIYIKYKLYNTLYLNFYFDISFTAPFFCCCCW